MAILTSPTDGRTDEQVYARRWWTLGVLCLSLLIVFGGNSTLNVALPTLVREVGASTSQLQWIVDSYIVVFAGLLLVMGSVGDRFGRKGVLSIGLVVFGAASFMAALSRTPAQLICCGAYIFPFASSGEERTVRYSTISRAPNRFACGE